MFAKDVDVLIQIGIEQASFFCNDAVYADVTVHGQRHTYGVESASFAKWLRHQYYEQKKGAASSSAIKTAVRTLVAKAEFGGRDSAASGSFAHRRGRGPALYRPG
jgi:hypothetical protein